MGETKTTTLQYFKILQTITPIFTGIICVLQFCLLPSAHNRSPILQLAMEPFGTGYKMDIPTGCVRKNNETTG
jgi:hypothetical protein